MFREEQLLPISALQHFRFCQRRAALVHIEGLWAENRYTVEGNQLHEKAHDPRRGEHRPGVRIVRGMMLRSFAYGIVGKADVVELSDVSGTDTSPTANIIEYKRGKPKPRFDREFRIQLCAQTLCLEEMLPASKITAAIYYGQARQRFVIELDQALRSETINSIQALHQLIQQGITPSARYTKKCDRCSMKNLCLPQALRPKATAESYLAQVIASTRGAEIPDEIWL